MPTPDPMVQEAPALQTHLKTYFKESTHKKNAIEAETLIRCPVCRHESEEANGDLGKARGNTSQYKSTEFSLWKCRRCDTIHVLDEVDFKAIYATYPLKDRKLDPFARGTFASLMKRLRGAGLHQDQRILDYGCGNGIFIRYLNELGYQHVDGYDPFVEGYQTQPEKASYDFVICNDVIEHVDEPHQLMEACSALLSPGGTLYVGTSDSKGIEMNNLKPHLMRLHLPYHRVLFTEESLHFIAREAGFDVTSSWRKSYMDTWRPFCNYRFLDEFNEAMDHEMDKAFEPGAAWAMLRKPSLWFYAFFGKWCSKVNEPAVVLRKPKQI